MQATGIPNIKSQTNCVPNPIMIDVGCEDSPVRSGRKRVSISDPASVGFVLADRKLDVFTDFASSAVFVGSV